MQRIGQTVIVDNRPGAGGNIGTSSFVREPADGHTLVMATSSTNAANPHLYSTLGFDPVEDFALVGNTFPRPSNALSKLTGRTWSAPCFDRTGGIADKA